jgi:exodeoxyribonuclease-3
MKIATWNVNSIRTRLERVTAWLAAHEPDVVCLQETKVVDDDFPRAELEDLGYAVETYGQKTYNGVALLSRHEMKDVARGISGDGDDAEARAIAATIDGVRVMSVYVPNGQSITSEKFAYKIDWLHRLLEGIDAERSPKDPMVVAGDFNIAPDDRDVYDPEQWRGRIHFHPKEHEALARFFDWGFADVLRAHHDEPGLYSWWDYRRGAFPRDLGLRIDLVLATEPMVRRSKDCVVDKDERKEPKGASKPSDHAPVVATFR